MLSTVAVVPDLCSLPFCEQQHMDAHSHVCRFTEACEQRLWCASDAVHDTYGHHNCAASDVCWLSAAISAYGSQMSQTIALKMVQASLATAMSYLSVVWGIMSGYLVFSEVCS